MEDENFSAPLPMSPAKPNLIYTVAFDPPGSEGCRMLAKMLASSLLRTFFTGDILVFRNSPAPLFLVERKGLEEICVSPNRSSRESFHREGREEREEEWQEDFGTGKWGKRKRMRRTRKLPVPIIAEGLRTAASIAALGVDSARGILARTTLPPKRQKPPPSKASGDHGGERNEASPSAPP